MFRTRYIAEPNTTPPPRRSEGDVYSADPAKAPHALWVPGLGEVAVTLYRKGLFDNAYQAMEQTGARRVRIVVPADDRQMPLPLPPHLANETHRGCVPFARAALGCLAGIAAGVMFTMSFVVSSPVAGALLAIGGLAATLAAIVVLTPPDYVHEPERAPAHA